MQIRASYREHFPTFTARSAVPIYFLLTVMIAYAVITPTLYSADVRDGRPLTAYLMLGAIVFGGVNVSYAIGTRSFQILMRSILCFALFYVVTSHVEITKELLANNKIAGFELNYGWIVAVICGIIGWFRPSFVLVPVLYTVWQKQQLANVFAFHVDWMDYFTLIETGTVLILGFLSYATFRRLLGPDILTLKRTVSEAEAGDTTIHAVDMLVILAVALHFGNYFYAGLIKAVLGENLTYWFLHNQTQILMLSALESAVLPISFSDGLTSFAYTALDNVKVLTNLATILIQLLAVVAILKPRWAIIITLCFDAMHLMIFFLTGIFFWKFIVLNLAIVAALTVMRVQPFPPAMKRLFFATVILSPFVFKIYPSYAWLDSRSMNSIRLVAVTEDGSEYRVPSSYFLGMSITFAQHRMIWPEMGPVPTETWGTTRNSEIMHRGLACEWGYESGELPKATYYTSTHYISRFVRRYHQQVLAMVDGGGYFNYDLFPHHIFSTPWNFQEFKALDKRRIVNYRYENNVVCLLFKDGVYAPKSLWTSQFNIPIH